MRTHRGGFTLIELIIAISIAGVMSIVLFRSLFQINMSTTLSDRVMSFDEKAERLVQLFDHDLAGATTLIDNEPPKEELATDMKQTPTAGGQQPSKKEDKEKKEPEKKPKKIITKLFNSTNAGERLDTVTFVSNNPMTSYWISQHGTESAGKPKPNLVRITYILKEDPENKDSFILKRQESVPLDWEKRSGKIYDVMTGIKNISVEYTQKIEKIIKIEEKKEEASKDKGKTGQPSQQPAEPAGKQPKPSKGPKTKTEVEYKTLKTWDTDQKEEEKAKQEEKEAKKEKEQIKKKPIPVLVKITASIFDNTLQRTVEFVFFVPIITDTEFAPKKHAQFQMPRLPMPGPQGGQAQPGAGQPGAQGQKVTYRTSPFNARLYS